jgi:hypothetical protein
VTRPDVEYPPVGDAEYELRFTRRALQDLDCPTDTPPGDLDAVLASTIRTDIVEEFRDQRAAAPTGTGGTLHNVGRPDIHPLHGTAGGRSCTWHDPGAGVCWFLGYTPEHDYGLFETRAANDELLPDEWDETLLELEREQLDFALRVGPGLRALIQAALATSGAPQRGCVGELLRLEVTVVIVPIDESALADLFISIAVPLYGDETVPPPDWPGSQLQQRLLEVAFGDEGEPHEWDVPQTIPASGKMRAINHARELALAVRNLDPEVLI